MSDTGYLAFYILGYYEALSKLFFHFKSVIHFMFKRLMDAEIIAKISEKQSQNIKCRKKTYTSKI